MTQPNQPDAAPIVERNAARHRYEILLDGTTAGFAAYRDRDGQRVFHHTEIDDAFAGRGLASRLVHEALSDTRTAGRRIVPVCPFVAKYLTKHGEFSDSTDLPTPDILRWLEADRP
ncbi:GNAT family N-acetyltransferase [Streptomyces sp. B6B3]|uniref:GNAT family N-acetyltransferase n=1 Tax=Streptomyces sp. B6B3 TaxID=3153570 RepID=UPI00325CD362